MTDTPQSPQPGAVLDADSVKLLLPGDWLRRVRDGLLVRLPDAVAGITIWTETHSRKIVGGSPDDFTFLGRPDAEGWIAHDGGPNPAPGLRVDVRLYSGETVNNVDATVWAAHWKPACADSPDADHIAFWRPHRPPAVEPEAPAGRDKAGPYYAMSLETRGPIEDARRQREFEDRHGHQKLALSAPTRQPEAESGAVHIGVDEKGRWREGGGDDPLPCPWCGRVDLLGVEREPERGFLVVKCRACGAMGRGRLASKPIEAQALWNDRTAPAPAAGDVERLREALREAQSALDVADALIERSYGVDTPKEWHTAFRRVAKACQAVPLAALEQRQ